LLTVVADTCGVPDVLTDGAGPYRARLHFRAPVANLSVGGVGPVYTDMNISGPRAPHNLRLQAQHYFGTVD